VVQANLLSFTSQGPQFRDPYVLTPQQAVIIATPSTAPLCDT
jgi:hypothetical protein